METSTIDTAREQQERAAIAMAQARAQTNAVEASKAALAKRRPNWAKALIVAELEHDCSDIQTDYFSARTSRVVALAWSTHDRDLFSEMRKAASAFSETAHLGPGRDHYTARVVLSVDIPFEKAHSGGYFQGSYSHWHSELDGNYDGGKVFTTQAEASTFVATAPKPEPIGFDGFEATFEWQISKESVEHRQKWSMGGGYFLKTGGRYGDGWKVRKVGVDGNCSAVELDVLDGPKGQYPGYRRISTPTAKETDEATTATVSLNEEKHGVEMRFPAKPDQAILERLKMAGWHWNRVVGCWYTKDTPFARTFAASLMGVECDF